MAAEADTAAVPDGPQPIGQRRVLVIIGALLLGMLLAQRLQPIGRHRGIGLNGHGTLTSPLASQGAVCRGAPLSRRRWWVPSWHSGQSAAPSGRPPSGSYAAAAIRRVLGPDDRRSKVATAVRAQRIRAAAVSG